MLTTLASIALIFGLLLLSEYWWRRKVVHGEIGRKFVHVTVGTFVAFWPFFMSWQTIRLLSIAFFIVVGVSKFFNVFQAIHSVQRPTWGELFFALVVGAITLITQSKAIYAAALLQMSLADGFAAIIGTQFGQGNSYSVFGHKKSLVGSLTFFAISIAILVAYSQLHIHVRTDLIVAVAALATIIENTAVAGLDNLLVPLLVAFILNSVS